MCLTSILFLACSCTSTKTLSFANREWHVSSHYGQIIDKDTTYRFTFGNVLIPDPLVIISSADSVEKYPGMEKFITNILKTTRLDNSEILFYAPEMQTMFLSLKESTFLGKPSSISSSLNEEFPYTMWIHKDDVEKWKRVPTEMYTYTFYHKNKKQFLIVDCFDYGDNPVAQVTIFQNRNKKTEKMKLPDFTIRSAFFVNPDLSKYMNNVEQLSNWVETRRGRAISNYKIGQEQKQNRSHTSDVKM